MISLGDMRIYPINDGDILVDGGGPFGLVPRTLWKHIIAPDENNLVPMRLICLLVQTGGKNIIIDTGLGTHLNERQSKIWQLRNGGGLLRGLAQSGVSPAQIDLVINTHLHFDHCAGNIQLNSDGKIVPTFPNAQHVVQAREYQDAMHPNERTRNTYIAANYEPLVQSGQMRLLDGDVQLLDGVHGVVTGGHTPGHMSVRLESQGQHLLFTCDLSSYAAHFERLGWMTAYDVEPLVTLEAKRHWQAWALEQQATLIFPHDPHITAARLVQDGAVVKIQPIDTPCYGN
jgi:glyoxylase-like metal-dependent hydrolase (beta-lactamase superfamily II)